MDEKQLLETLQGIGNFILADMKVLIELNGAMATGRLLKEIRVNAIKDKDKYLLTLSYPFYGKFVDEGRRPGKMPPVKDIREWTKLKGIPESAAYPIAKKIGEKGTKGINFTEPFYDDIKVVADIMGDAFAKYIVKELLKIQK
jgi:hypothetical protein